MSTNTVQRVTWADGQTQRVQLHVWDAVRRVQKFAPAREHSNMVRHMPQDRHCTRLHAFAEALGTDSTGQDGFCIQCRQAYTCSPVASTITHNVTQGAAHLSP